MPDGRLSGTYTSALTFNNAAKHFHRHRPLSTGVTLAAGSGTWASVTDRNATENFVAVDRQKLLESLNAIPIENWNYKSQDRSIRHLGPMAQDFYAAFGLGEDDKHISTVDADVALAAIQALYHVIQEKDSEIQRLTEPNARLADKGGAIEDGDRSGQRTEAVAQVRHEAQNSSRTVGAVYRPHRS